jgi:2-iminobutanoate/2-iminopropanoate deaminase
MSSDKVVIQGDQAASGAPLSPAIAIGDLVFTSGQVGLDPQDGALAGPDVASQTRRCLENLKAILGSVQLSMADVIKTTVFLTDIGDFQAMNAAYREYFSAPYPARSTVAVVTLARPDLVVEIEAVAGRPGVGARA